MKFNFYTLDGEPTNEIELLQKVYIDDEDYVMVAASFDGTNLSLDFEKAEKFYERMLQKL